MAFRTRAFRFEAELAEGKEHYDLMLNDRGAIRQARASVSQETRI